MKVLLFNGADNEGGAAKAAVRLLSGLHEEGVEAALYVQRKSGNAPRVLGPESKLARMMSRIRPTLEETLLGIPPWRRNGPFSAAFLPDGLQQEVAGVKPDIVHLHWVARMMRLENLSRLRTPIVWTLHDSWPFTGGCYLPLDCERYLFSCGKCPVLGSESENDLSRRIWLRKQQAWRDLNLTVVAPSRWMAERAKASSLFHSVRVEVIPNGIDLTCYRPTNREQARHALSLPKDKKLVLFGAKGALSDRNKGWHLLREALGELAAGPLRERIELLIFGASPPDPAPDLGFPSHFLGWLGDDATLALLYCAADLFVFPSIQESLGYTAMEAMACGTPCVAFNQGGVPDLIDHRLSGYLARPYDPADLATGIAWVLADNGHPHSLGGNARTKIAEHFASDRIARLHMDLYREVLDKKRAGAGI